MASIGRCKATRLLFFLWSHAEGIAHECATRTHSLPRYHYVACRDGVHTFLIYTVGRQCVQGHLSRSAWNSPRHGHRIGRNGTLRFWLPSRAITLDGFLSLVSGIGSWHILLSLANTLKQQYVQRGIMASIWLTTKYPKRNAYLHLHKAAPNPSRTRGGSICNAI